MTPPRFALEHVAIERLALVDGTYQQLRILTGVDVVVPAGGRLVILGPSGAGKTSLLRILNRLDEPAAGQILLDGTLLQHLDPIAVRRRVGMLFQQPFLFDLTVEENLAYPLQLRHRRLEHDEAVARLAEVGLPADVLGRRAQQLSGGQQQRVALARTLVLDPGTLLLDEPTSALDEDSARILLEALLHRNEERGLTLIVVTHSQEIMRGLASPALLVHHGRADHFPDAESALETATREQVKVE